MTSSVNAMKNPNEMEYMAMETSAAPAPFNHCLGRIVMPGNAQPMSRA
jgi:hypothetical protein